MGMVTFDEWDPAAEIETKEDVIAYLEVALEENDPEFLLQTIGYIARSKGLAQLIKELDLNREGPYKSFLPKGNPSFLTVAKVLDKLGFRIKIEQKVSA
jgi:probable addiction module antidote protein